MNQIGTPRPGNPVQDPVLREQILKARPGAEVTDDALRRQILGVSPVVRSGDEADQRAAAMRDRRSNNPPPVDPSGTGNIADKAIRVASEGIDTAKQSFNAGGELGIDNSSGVTKIVTAIADALLRSVGATVEGGAAAIGQTAREAGASQGEANRLRRDVIGLTEVGALTPTPTRIGTKAVQPSAPAISTADETNAALRAAERLGVEVPKGATGELLPRLAGSIADAPIVGAPLQDAARKATDELESTASGISDALGGATLQGAGDTVKDNLLNWVKVTSKERAAELFAPIEKIVGTKTGPLSRTTVAINSLVKQSTEAGLPPPAIIKTLEEATTRPDGLTWQGMQRLRTEIGDRISGDIVPEPGLNKRALKQVYGALSEDIAFLVKRAGGKKGVEAWKSANDQFRTEISARRDAITKIVGAEGDAAAETVASRMLTMASDRRGADIQRLTEARKALGDDAWGQLASAAVGRLGQDKNGFSIAKFRTDYDKLSDAGKKLLFADDDHRAALDDIATVGKQFEQLARLGNPSGSARMGLAVGGIGLAAVEPLSLMATALGTYGVARALARPATAKAAAQWSKDYQRIHGGRITEEAYNAVKRSGLALRSALDREGIEALVIRPGVILNAPSNQEQPQ